MIINLRHLPATVRKSAESMAKIEHEVLHGWRAITETQEVRNKFDGLTYLRAVPVRYQVVTDKGIYEFTPDGLCVRASVLHSF